MVMACTHPGDNWLLNGDVLFMDWVLQGVSWDDVLLGLSGSSRTELMGGCRHGFRLRPGGRHVGGCSEWAMCLFLVGSLTSF